MNSIDLIIIVILLFGMVRGFMKGLVFEIISLVSFAVGIYGAIKFSKLFSIYLVQEQIVSEKLASIIAFVLIFISIWLIFWLSGKLIERFLKATNLNWLNKLGGAFFGACKFFLLIGVLHYFVNEMDVKFDLISEKTKQESVIWTFLEETNKKN